MACAVVLAVMVQASDRDGTFAIEDDGKNPDAA